MTAPPEQQQPNNPGYKPEYKELEEARKAARVSKRVSDETIKADHVSNALRWLAAEVRVMRLERALER